MNTPNIPESVVVDSALSTTSTNAIQNKVVTNALNNKVDKVEGKGLSTNDLTDTLKANCDLAYRNSHTHNNKTILDNITAIYTSEEKTKLNSIEAGAQVNPTIDSVLSTTSTNPVQNKIVYEVLSAVRENLLTQINNLSAVAKSGSYNDLTDKPSNATTSSAGLMSAADKSKLDGISSDSGNVKMIVYS